MLKVENLSISFGGLKAVDDLSFHVKQGQIFGLIGPNGAGKTTVFNCITQFYLTDEGVIDFTGKNGNVMLDKLKVHQIIKHGLVRTFQNVELIKYMTVMDNLLIGLHGQMKNNFIFDAFGFGKKFEKQYHTKAHEVLEFLNLSDIENEIAGSQPYGVQKLIELGRTLISDPLLIILDEPAAGMNRAETNELKKMIRRIRDELGITILLVEHDMDLVMNTCDEICVINFGKKITQGSPVDIKTNVDVQKAYLGEE